MPHGHHERTGRDPRERAVRLHHQRREGPRPVRPRRLLGADRGDRAEGPDPRGVRRRPAARAARQLAEEEGEEGQARRRRLRGEGGGARRERATDLLPPEEAAGGWQPPRRGLGHHRLPGHRHLGPGLGWTTGSR